MRANANFRFYELDVGDESQVEGIFARILADGWQPNVVLNNAAITGELLMGAGKPFPDFANTSVSDWERTLRTNLTGRLHDRAADGPRHRRANGPAR